MSGLDDEQITRRVWPANTYVRAVADGLARLKFRAGPDPDRPQTFNPNSPLAYLLGPAHGSTTGSSARRGPNPVTTR